MNNSIKRKKLLVIAYYFPPTNSSGVYRTLGFIKYLFKSSWDISVLTVKIDEKNLKDDYLFCKIYDKIKIYRAKCIDYFYLWKKFHKKKFNDKNFTENGFTARSNRTSGYWQTIKNQISGLLQTPDNQAGWFFPALLRASILPRPDIIYSTAPPFTGLVIAAFLKRIWKVPLVVDYRDPWSGNPFNIAHGGMAARFNSVLERYVMRTADTIIANTGSMAKHFSESFPDENEKIHVITNGYDHEDYREITPLRTVEPEIFLMVHIGLLYEGRNPLPFLQAIKNLLTDQSVKDQIAVQLIGESESFEGLTLVEMVHQLNLTDVVELVPPVSHQEALARAKAADVLLLFAQGTRLQIPAKLFEYVALGPPMLAVCEEESATQEMLACLHGHQVATRNRADVIEPCIRELHRNWQQNDRISLGKDKYIEKLSRRKLTMELESILLSNLKN